MELSFYVTHKKLFHFYSNLPTQKFLLRKLPRSKSSYQLKSKCHLLQQFYILSSRLSYKFYNGHHKGHNSPELMKNGILNLPDNTRSRNDCNVDPSNGSAPQTSTYNTTPSDWWMWRKIKDERKSLVSLNYKRANVENIFSEIFTRREIFTRVFSGRQKIIQFKAKMTATTCFYFFKCQSVILKGDEKNFNNFFMEIRESNFWMWIWLNVAL